MYAYTYRDYVIRAFNTDLPYDQFLREQLAADLLPADLLPATGGRRPIEALGFLTLGRNFTGNPHDIIDDRIDVTTRALLALTVSCALPRPQVRSDSHGRLLLALRHLRQ